MKDLIVDDDLFDIIHQVTWTIVKQSKNSSYAQNRMNGKLVLLHRILMGANPWEMVDHINGNGLDNRLDNLRLCNKSTNAMNRDKTTVKKTSNYKGVHWNKQKSKWQVEIELNYKKKYIGRYENQEQAAHAYNGAAKIYHGAFARLNIIN